MHMIYTGTLEEKLRPISVQNCYEIYGKNISSLNNLPIIQVNIIFICKRGQMYGNHKTIKFSPSRHS